MVNESDESHIFSTPFFSRLPRETKKALLKESFTQHFAKGSVLYRKGEPARFLFLPLSGSLAWISEREGSQEGVIDFLGPGDPIGVLAVFKDVPHHNGALVVEDSAVLLIPAEVFRERARTDVELAMVVLDLLAVRIWAFAGQVEALKQQPACQRLAAFLLRYIEAEVPGQADGPIILKLPWSRPLMATRLGIVPESMSRVVAELKPYGVESHGRRIVIQSAERLRELAVGGPIARSSKG